jgi:hypothetical protein
MSPGIEIGMNRRSGRGPVSMESRVTVLVVTKGGFVGRAVGAEAGRRSPCEDWRREFRGPR